MHQHPNHENPRPRRNGYAHSPRWLAQPTSAAEAGRWAPGLREGFRRRSWKTETRSSRLSRPGLGRSQETGVRRGSEAQCAPAAGSPRLLSSHGQETPVQVLRPKAADLGPGRFADYTSHSSACWKYAAVCAPGAYPSRIRPEPPASRAPGGPAGCLHRGARPTPQQPPKLPSSR